MTLRIFNTYVVLALLLMMAPSAEVAAQRPTIAGTPKQQIRGKLNRDANLLKALTANIQKTMQSVDANDSLFSLGRKKDFDIREKELLYQLWGNYLDHVLAFEGLTANYRDFFLLTDRKEHAGAFLLAYTAYVAKVSHGLRFISRTAGNDLYEKKLDDPNPAYGIPGGMYAKLKWNTLHVKDVSSVLAGYQYYSFLRKYYRKQGFHRDPMTSWMFDYIEERYASIRKDLGLKGVGMFAANGLDIVKETTFAAWFPVQMNVSEWMGDTKVRRVGSTLITLGQITAMKERLEPGDIIVERRNWYLSNIGLPGFWPHAELYIGTYEEMKRFFSDPAVMAYYQQKGPYRDFLQYLEARHPEQMKKYLQKGHDGYAHRIIEAVSEGVKFSSLEEGTSADYIGVLRPRLSKLDIAKAIDEAFHYIGRPYDFNFDFLTDSAIVCSELIYKVYLRGADKKGINLRLRDIAGRKALPANDIVEKFAAEDGTAGSELSFVYFLDGTEKEKRAVLKGPTDLKESYSRMKWDIAQK